MPRLLFCLLLLGVASANSFVLPPPLTSARPSPKPSPAALPPSLAPVPPGGAAAPVRNPDGATIPNLVFNLVKNIVGAGVLSLPAGVAAFGDAPSAVVPAAALAVFIGCLSGYCFSLIGRVCGATGAGSYREAWSRSVGERSSWAPAAACTTKTGVACLAYSMILADTIKALLATAAVDMSRSNSLFLITGTVLAPLCMLRNLSSLAPFSILGTVGLGFTALAMAFRYLSGSYATATPLLAAVAAPLQPAFGVAGWKAFFKPKSAILLCMLSTAYLAHYNAPKFFNELQNNTVARYNKMVGLSFLLSMTLSVSVMSFGFLTFGGAASGLILNNYANIDPLMTFCRVAVAAAIVASYPLTFVGVREGTFDLLNVPVKDRTPSAVNKMTFALLAAFTGGALVVKDLSMILSVGGATLGNFLVFIAPALMFRATFKGPESGTERRVAGSIGAFGVVMGALGCYMSFAK